MSRKSKTITSKPSSDAYREGHERVFGGVPVASFSDIALLTGAQDLTPKHVAELAREVEDERAEKKRRRKKSKESATGTYAIRNGELVKISARADGYEDPSTRLNGERVVQWTELPRAINPAGKTWKKWKKVGAVQFPIFDGDGDRRKYQQVCRDAGYARAWVK